MPNDAKKRATRNDVAEAAGVSTATVSYVLSGRRDVRVSESTRSRVMQAVKEVGYVLNHSGRALATGHHKMVAMWPITSDLPYHAKIAGVMQRVLMQDDFGAITCDQVYRNGAPVFRFTEWPVDGVVTIGSSRQVREFLTTSAACIIPVVGMGNWLNRDDGGDYVAIDLYPAAEAIMRHLVSIGCRRIISISSFQGIVRGDMRSAAYETVMEEAGLSVEYIVITARRPREDCRKAVNEYIAAHGCPDAFYCRNDELALSAYRGVHDMGFSVPEDVVITGCDGIQETEYVDTPITTIVQPVEEMCTQAWKFLQSRMDDPSLPGRQVTLPAKLALRRSTLRQ